MIFTPQIWSRSIVSRNSFNPDDENLLCGRTEKDFEAGEKIVSNLKYEI